MRDHANRHAERIATDARAAGHTDVQLRPAADGGDTSAEVVVHGETEAVQIFIHPGQGARNRVSAYLLTGRPTKLHRQPLSGHRAELYIRRQLTPQPAPPPRPADLAWQQVTEQATDGGPWAEALTYWNLHRPLRGEYVVCGQPCPGYLLRGSGIRATWPQARQAAHGLRRAGWGQVWVLSTEGAWHVEGEPSPLPRVGGEATPAPVPAETGSRAALREEVTRLRAAVLHHRWAALARGLVISNRVRHRRNDADSLAGQVIHREGCPYIPHPDNAASVRADGTYWQVNPADGLSLRQAVTGAGRACGACRPQVDPSEMLADGAGRLPVPGLP